jgi:hypothetical protein
MGGQGSQSIANGCIEEVWYLIRQVLRRRILVWLGTKACLNVDEVKK